LSTKQTGRPPPAGASRSGAGNEGKPADRLRTRADAPLRPLTEGNDVSPDTPGRTKRLPQNHRTVDRVTRILEEVVYKPGMTFAELVRALGAAKSSVHGFISGLLANGWLHEEQRRFYLGPAVYALTLASGHIRAGLVTHTDLLALHQESGVGVFLGVQAGDQLIYIAEAGSDQVTGFAARSNIRRSLLDTAGGKALLAARSDAERDALLRRSSAAEAELVERFLNEYQDIKDTRIATNTRRKGAQYAIATAVHNQFGVAVAAITLVGPTPALRPREKKLARMLLRAVESWSRRSMTPREPI
jgi:DNA-binding IclR family transcriptional regulator